MKKVILSTLCAALLIGVAPLSCGAGIPKLVRVDSLSDLPLPGEVLPASPQTPSYYAWAGVGAVATLLALVVSRSHSDIIIESVDETQKRIRRAIRTLRAKMCPCRTRLGWCFCESADGICACLENGGVCGCITKDVNYACCNNDQAASADESDNQP